MLIHDRRRCRPLQSSEVRMRLTLRQRAQLGQLERSGWHLLFVRGETSLAYVTHPARGHGVLGRDGRLIAVRTLPRRQDDSGDSSGITSLRAGAPPAAAHPAHA